MKKSIFLALIILFSFSAPAVLADASDNFNAGFGSWSSNGYVQRETAICGSACESVKLSDTTQSSPNGILSKSFTVTVGARYQVRIKAGVYTDGAIPDGSVTLYALADDPNIEGNPNQVTWCHNTNCEALGSSIGSTFLEVNIIPQLSTLTITIEGNQGGCDIVGGSCHDPLVDDFSLVKTADPPVLTNNAATCTSISVNSGNPITTGQTYSAVVTMRNDGDTTWTSGANYKLGAQDPRDDPNWGTSTGADSNKGTRPTRQNVSSSVGPGSTATFTFNVTAPDTAGTYRFAFQMVKDGTGGEWFGGKCEPNLIVSAPLIPSRLDVACSVSPTSANLNQEVTWTATARGGAGTHTYTWAGDDGLSSTGTRTVVDDITPTTHPVTKSYTSVGTKTARVKVTSTDGQDTGFVNCTNSVTVTAPDLVADTLTPSSATSGQSITLSGRVLNQGNAAAASSQTRLRIDLNNDGSWDTTLASQSTGSLTAGNFETENWSWTVPVCTGTCTHKYEVYADNGSAVTESNETNNWTTRNLTVSSTSQPDLTTTLNSFTSPSTGVSVTFTGRVYNEGSVNAAASSARFCMDNSGCLTSSSGRIGSDHSVPALSAGSSSSNITSSSWTATTGSHTAYFCADVGDVVTEGVNEGSDSNCSSRSFTVSGGSPTPTPTPTSTGIRPWIQTTGGDVHSNTGINTPGGPE